MQKFTAIMGIGMGVIVVAGLLLVRRDLTDLSLYGKRVRRFIEIGLLVLVCFGVTEPLAGCGSGEVTEQAGLIKDNDRGSVAKTSTWRRFLGVWQLAEEIAAGEKGSYPYTDAGKKRLLAGLEEGRKDADYFVKRQLLSQPEGELLKLTVSDMMADAGKYRTEEMKGVTCYLPMIHHPGGRSAERLAARIPLLRQVAESECVQGAVLELVFSSMEDEIAELEQLKGRQVSTFNGKYDVDSLLTETTAAIEALRSEFGITNQKEQGDAPETP